MKASMTHRLGTYRCYLTLISPSPDRLHHSPHTLRPRLRSRHKAIHPQIHRIPLRLKEINIKSPKQRRDTDEQLRVCQLHPHAGPRAAAESHHVAGQQFPVGGFRAVEPALRFVGEAVGKNDFVVRDGEVVHADGYVGRDGPGFVGDGHVGCPGEALCGTVGEAEGLGGGLDDFFSFRFFD